MLNRIGFAAAALALLVAAALVAYLTLAPTLAPSPALAKGNLLQTNAADASTGVNVSGEGRVRVKPNIAMSTIGIDVTATSLADASSQANTKMAAIIDKIKSMGVAEKDIQTTNYSVQPLTDQPRPAGGTPKITGYRITNQVSITVRKIDDLGKILDAVVAAGANNIYGVSFGVDDPTPYQEQARTAAVKDARAKAEQLAKAGGLTLGKIVWINEGGEAPRPIVRAAVSLAEGATPIETGELEISVSVQVRFALQ